MKYELPPRNWIAVDENTTRLATDEEYAEYLTHILQIEGIAILEEESTETESEQ